LQAHLLKESFGQLREYCSVAWARKFFENWRASLKGQKLEPFEKFAKMIDSYWERIAPYCLPKNKVSLGFVEGLNNKIRVIQRHTYGLRDEEYFRLKNRNCILPEILAIIIPLYLYINKSKRMNHYTPPQAAYLKHDCFSHLQYTPLLEILSRGTLHNNYPVM